MKSLSFPALLAGVAVGAVSIVTPSFAAIDADAAIALAKKSDCFKCHAIDDGSEEEHPVVKTKDLAAQKNLAGWILSQ